MTVVSLLTAAYQSQIGIEVLALLFRSKNFSTWKMQNRSNEANN